MAYKWWLWVDEKDERPPKRRKRDKRRKPMAVNREMRARDREIKPVVTSDQEEPWPSPPPTQR